MNAICLMGLNKLCNTTTNKVNIININSNINRWYMGTPLYTVDGCANAMNLFPLGPFNNLGCYSRFSIGRDATTYKTVTINPLIYGCKYTKIEELFKQASVNGICNVLFRDNIMDELYKYLYNRFDNVIHYGHYLANMRAEQLTIELILKKMIQCEKATLALTIFKHELCLPSYYDKDKYTNTFGIKLSVIHPNTSYKLQKFINSINFYIVVTDEILGITNIDGLFLYKKDESIVKSMFERVKYSLNYHIDYSIYTKAKNEYETMMDVPAYAVDVDFDVTKKPTLKRNKNLIDDISREIIFNDDDMLDKKIKFKFKEPNNTMWDTLISGENTFTTISTDNTRYSMSKTSLSSNTDLV